MRARVALLLLIVLVPAFAVPAQGQLFRKPTPPQPRPDINSKVPELLTIIKSDPDEKKRGAAIDLLQRVDAAKHPEIVPVLIEALLKDPKPNVRLEAVQTLARVRPPSAEVGQALEQAMEKDPSRMVKTYARTAYMPHRSVTMQAKKAEEAKAATTTATPRPSAGKTTSALKTPTPANPTVPQPLPAGPTFTAATPVPPAQANQTKIAPVEGPVLAPPK